MRVLESAHKNKIQTLALPVNKVVRYDVENLKVNLNDKFSFKQELESLLR